MDTNLYEQRTRVQNQLTNTFLKGMDTDTSDMLLGSDQYRYAENVRIVTNTDNNTGELRLIEGTNEIEYPSNILGEKIIAVDYIRDIAIFITVRNTTWSVYRRKDGEYTLVLKCDDEKIWNGDITIDEIRKSITTVLRWESDQNIKLYIADSTGKHAIMVINVAPGKELGDKSFEDAFGYQKTLLPPLSVKVSEDSGNIVSGKVQYAYRLYSKNKPATQISILSSTLSLYRNTYSGYEAEKPSGRSVDITIPQIDKHNLDYIQIYRISYQISGQLPKISLIKDQKSNFSIIKDSGIDIEEIAISDFLSLFTSQIYPSQIESKGDYLFAANMKYSQDDIDEKYTWFDSKSYSLHNYKSDGSGIVSVDSNNIASASFDGITLENLRSVVFYDSNSPRYNENGWKEFKLSSDSDVSYNGVGLYISWRYIYDNGTDDEGNYINPTAKNQLVFKNSNATFRCGETYRFGVKLYNKDGQSTSVKWIADIMIPYGSNMYKDGDTTKIRNVGIEFLKTPGSDWRDIYGWEIVRCERGLKDRSTLTQGIVGFPVREAASYDNTNSESWRNDSTDTNLICTPGVFSTDYFVIDSHANGSSNYKIAKTYEDVVMFSSPEFCYQQDDIEDILNSYRTQLHLRKIYKVLPNTEKYSSTKVYTQQSENSNYSFPFTCGHVINNSQGNVEWGYFQDYASNAYAAELRGKTIRDNQAITTWFINYFTPNYTLFTNYQYNTETLIEDIQFIDSPKYDDFASSEHLVFMDSVKTIGNLLFINWSTPLLLDLGSDESIAKSWLDNYTDKTATTSLSDIQVNSNLLYPIGAGGKTILLKQSLKEIKYTPISTTDFAPSITVMNLQKPCVPYGGYNKSSIDNSLYISFGDYSSVTQPISVYSGDTKNCIFTYHASHGWYDSTYKNCKKMATVYAIPVETDIDIQALYGLLYGVGGFSDYRVLDVACAFESYTQDKSAYLYNTAYNSTPDIMSWTTPEVLETKQDQFDTRIHYSNPKVNNEDIDSWSQFQASNYIDVDTRYGEITDLKLFKDKLIFWQENAAGIVAVNERVVLNDQNDTQVVLGTGGVLERYDYFTTVYGQKKNQHACTTSNDSLYWWDGNNKEILLYLQKYDVIQLSTSKHIRNYINGKNESTTPFMTYDPKYKEVLMNVVNNECVVYNEYIEAFTSIYTFNPIYEAFTNGELRLTSDEFVYKYNSSSDELSILFDKDATPLIKYVVNYQPTYNKTYDIQIVGGRFYGGGLDEDRSLPYTGEAEEFIGDEHARNNDVLKNIKITYKTPLKQESHISGDKMTNLEYDFRLTIPRNIPRDEKLDWGDRMRGKTMQCEIKSDSNNLDFALQYVTTKFRMSWT